MVSGTIFRGSGPRPLIWNKTPCSIKCMRHAGVHNVTWKKDTVHHEKNPTLRHWSLQGTKWKGCKEVDARKHMKKSKLICYAAGWCKHSCTHLTGVVPNKRACTLTGTIFWWSGPRAVIWALPTQRAPPTYLGGGYFPHFAPCA